MTVLRILFGAAFVVMLCIAAGEFLLRALQIGMDRAGRRFAQFTLGSVPVSSFIFALCALHQFKTGLFLVAGTLVIAAWVYVCRPRLGRSSLHLDLPPLWLALFWIPWAVFGSVYLIVAMAPEISADGTGYHLGLVYRYYEHHGFYRVQTSMFAGLYEGIEMLFLGAFSIGKHSSAALVHLTFLLLAPFGMLAIAKRMEEPRAGVLAAMLFYLSPVVGKDGASAYIDVGTAVILVAAFFFLQVWAEKPMFRSLAPAALLAGFAVACKMTAGSFLLYALFAVLTIRLPWKARVSQAAGLIAVAALPVLPWLIKDYVQFHNPFFPVLNRYFPNPFMLQLVEDEMRRIMAHVNDVRWAQIPWEATTGGRLYGILGPVFLLLPVAFLGVRRRGARQLLLAAAFILLTYPSSIGTRFLIPALPFLALAMSIAITRIPFAGTGLATAVLVAHGLLSWPYFIGHWTKSFQWRLDVMEWRAALRIMPEQEFLRFYWPDYERGLLLDRYVAPGELVYSPNMGQMAYQRRDVVGNSDSALGRRTFLTYLMPFSIPLGNIWTRDIKVASTSTRGVRLVATSAQDTDMRVSEVRFYSGGRELTRKPTWRITASANPWDAPLAFDNSQASFWMSGENTKPGMWLEVDFGEDVQLDRIVVEQQADQRWTQMEPAFPNGIGGAGSGWAMRPSPFDGTETPRHLSLRMETHDELWRLGIRWMVMPDSFYGAADVRDHADEWGVAQAGMARDFRLWKLLPPHPDRL